MDWVTLTRHQIENDALPSVCMVCGQQATCRVNQSFSHTPEWVQWLYLAGIFPGLLVSHFLTKQMRVSCPFCDRHRHHWTSLYWLAGLGWLLAGLLFAGLGFLIGMALAPSTAQPRLLGTVLGAGLGIICWIVVLIYVASTRIDATKVTSDEITLQGVHDTFAKAVRDRMGA